MPTAFWAELRRRGVRLLDVPEDEFVQTQATNILTVAPRKCIMLEGSPVTRQLLEMADCEVVTFPGEPLSLKAESGPSLPHAAGTARPGVKVSPDERGPSPRLNAPRWTRSTSTVW